MLLDKQAFKKYNYPLLAECYEGLELIGKLRVILYDKDNMYIDSDGNKYTEIRPLSDRQLNTFNKKGEINEK